MARNKSVNEKNTLAYNASFVFEPGTMFLMKGKLYIYVGKVYYDYNINYARTMILTCKTVEPKSKFVAINVDELGKTEVYITK